VSLTDLVSGSTSGTLTLDQFATGGRGGNATDQLGGVGGDAASSLTFTDGAAAGLTGEVRATGGLGGNGGSGGTGGAGGSAAAAISLSSTLSGVNVTAKSTGKAGAGGSGGAAGVAGAATAAAQATAVGSGKASATALLSDGASSGNAQASSTSNTGAGASVSASAAAPAGGPATAISLTTLGDSGPVAPFISSVAKGTSASYVTGLPTGYPVTPKVQAFTGGTLYALGEMTNVYGGAGESITYTTTANFRFDYGANSQLRLAVGGDAAINAGFDSSELRVLIDGVQSYDKSFATLSDWESLFFPGGGPGIPIDIGALLAGGLADVEIIYTLEASSNSGFQFDYAFGTVPGASAVPAPATLPLFAAGLGILGLLTWHRKKKPAAPFSAA
jgi:hypothetical protein